MKSTILPVICSMFLVLIALRLMPPVFAQHFRIAVLAPDTESFQSLAHQMIGGATIAARELDIPTPDVIWGDFRNERKVRDAYDEIRAMGVDIVIGGLVRESATAIASAEIDNAITTVLLSSGVRRELNPSLQNIIQMGLSEAAVYRIGLERWQRSENINAVQVLYRGENPRSFYFGARITPYIFEKYMSDKVDEYDFVDLSQFGKLDARYFGSLQREFMFHSSSSNGGTGYIVSGDDHDKVDFFSALERNNLRVKENISVYLADTISTYDVISSILEHTPTKVYMSAQFLPDLEDLRYRQFLQKVEMVSYPWYERVLRGRDIAHSSVAVKAHDAVKVAIEVLQRLGSGQPTRGFSVSGIGGNLTLLDDGIVTAPINTVILDPDGSVTSCFNDDGDCTP